MPLPFKIAFAVLPFLSAFIFPYPFTYALAFLAGLVFPPLALAVGIMLDFLYYAGGWPWGVTVGLMVALLSASVRYVVRTRIM